MVLTYELTDFISQTATSTLLSGPVPAILQREKFGLRPEYFEQ